MNDQVLMINSMEPTTRMLLLDTTEVVFTYHQVE